MDLLFRISAKSFPLTLTAAEALDFYQRWPNADSFVLIMAANWRVSTLPGEELWFEELTEDELEDEDFLDDFKEATIQLWMT